MGDDSLQQHDTVIISTLSGRDTPSSESDQEMAGPDKRKVLKKQQMYTWNSQFEKWHECELSFTPPYLYITEHEDTRIEIQDKQLQHHQERWFHGNISRREAKYILQDYSGGDGTFLVRTSESFNGKFAISFIHEERVKHVVIETKPDPVIGVLYHITSQGPFFNSVTELIEEAKKSCIIQNHMFDVILTKSPPKPDQRWLHKNIKTLSQAEQLMRKRQQDGSFFVYKTSSDYAPYSLVYRSNGCIIHAPVMSGQRAYSLYGVSAPVLYKLIHYYMENPIEGDLMLQYPVIDNNSSMSNCAIAGSDWDGDRTKNELSFNKGALITNISRRSSEWCVGDHRGDKQKFFPTSVVRLLSIDELHYVKEVRDGLHRSFEKDYDELDSLPESGTTNSLNLWKDYTVSFDNDDSLVMKIEPINPTLSQFGSFKLSCPTSHDLIQWYQVLEQNQCLSTSRRSSETSVNVAASNSSKKRKGRKKRGSCIIS